VTKLRSRPPDVVSADQVDPLLTEVTNWPFAYASKLLKPVVAQLHVYAAVPLEKLELSRKINA
jgi:hypothetical protein